MIAEDKTLITLYHNTSNSNAINIAKSGIKTGMRLQAYGNGSEAEGSGIWCTTVRGYGYGGATITFQISQDDKDLWKANDTEYVVYRDININEIIDIDLLVAHDIVINSERNDSMGTVVESDIPAGIKEFGKDKLLQVFKNYPDLLVSPYSSRELEHLINTGEKYCMGKIKVEEDRTISNKSYVLRGLENSKSFDIAYNDSRGSLENFMAKLQPAHPNVHMWIEENDFVHNPTSLREAKQVLVEVSRNELLALTKSDTITRYNKASGYKGFSITDIDTSNILRDNTLVVTCKVGDYHDTVELEDILYWIQVVAENTNSYTKNQVNTKVVTQAIMNSIDGMDIKVDCECGDWKYRFAYQATVLGYKYGKPETRPNRYKRTNMDNVGALCKHLTSMLSNKRWLQQVTSKVMDFIEQNIDAVNAFLKPKKGMELTLPNELARQNAKTSWQNRRNQKSDEEDKENNDNITDMDNNLDTDDTSTDNTTNSNNSVNNDNKDTVDNSIDNSANKSIDGENGEEE